MEEFAGSAGEATAESDRGQQKPEEPAGEREHYQEPVRDQRCQHHLETTRKHTDTHTVSQHCKTQQLPDLGTNQCLNRRLKKHTHTRAHTMQTRPSQAHVRQAVHM